MQEKICLKENEHYPSLKELSFEELLDRQRRTQNVYWYTRKANKQPRLVSAYHYYLSVLQAEIWSRIDQLDRLLDLIDSGEYFEISNSHYR